MENFLPNTIDSRVDLNEQIINKYININWNTHFYHAITSNTDFENQNNA